jgi:hypothetical protein
MRTTIVNKAKATRLVAEQGQLLTKYPYRQGVSFLELTGYGDGLPVLSQQHSCGSTFSNLRIFQVLLCTQHLRAS